MDPIKALMLQAGIKTNSFPPSSRYQLTETALYLKGNKQRIIHLKRRFVPQPESFTNLQEHIVQQGERPDHIANQYLGDPERFWQLCDANGVLHPLELTEETGSMVQIGISTEISGNNHV